MSRTSKAAYIHLPEEPLRWSRPGLLSCQCGASLSERPRNALISLAETDLLDIIRLKVLGFSNRAYCSGLPTRDLQAMSMRCLVQLINTLGKCYMDARNETDLADYESIVHSASNVLDEWPEKFFRLLERLTKDIPTDSYVQLAQGPIRGIYYLASKCIQPIGHAYFLRNALSDFSAIHGGRTFKHGNLKGSGESEHPRRFISIGEFAQQHGITPQTAARFVRAEKISSIQSQRGEFNRVVDCGGIPLPRKSPGSVYRMETAAKLIGIPRRVLRALKASGDFEVNHLPGVMPGVHELDVQAFIERLLSLAITKTSDQSMPHDVIQFNLIASSHYGPYSRVDFKAIIIRLMFSNKLPVVGCGDGTVGGLLVSKHDLEHVAREWKCL